MKYAIREGLLTDIPVLLSIFQEAVCETACSHYTPEQIAAWAKRGTSNRFHELFSGGLCFFLAERRKRGIGFASVSAQGFLHSLFVRPDFQRKGVASALLATATHFAMRRGAQCVTVEASITALPFFRAKGFVVLEEQEVALDGVRLKNYRMQSVDAGNPLAP